MTDKKPIAIEICDCGRIVYVMPAEADDEAEHIVFVTKIVFKGDFEFASDEMRNLYGQGTERRGR